MVAFYLNVYSVLYWKQDERSPTCTTCRKISRVQHYALWSCCVVFLVTTRQRVVLRARYPSTLPHHALLHSIVNQCNIFHFHHLASVENANPIFPRCFSFRQLDIPVSQNLIFLACSFSTLYLSLDFT